MANYKRGRPRTAPTHGRYDKWREKRLTRYYWWIKASNGSGTTTTTSGGSFYTQATYTSIDKAYGASVGSDTRVITGVGFANGDNKPTVTFGGTSATSVTVTNSTTLTVVTPAHAAGTVDIVLTFADGTTSVSNAFTFRDKPTISSVSPATVPGAGGTTVTLTGTGFLDTAGGVAGSAEAEVYIGSISGDTWTKDRKSTRLNSSH